MGYRLAITLLSLSAFLFMIDFVAGRGVSKYTVYTCPLDFLGKKKCEKRGWLPYAPYGIQHTFIKIGNTCYDWGDWDFARHVSCTGSAMDCCYLDSTEEDYGYTSCAHRIGEFERAWEREVKTYTLWTWNCQKFTDAMVDFLDDCPYNAADSVPSD